MTIHFADPGYDATALIVCGIITGAFLLIPIFFSLVHLSRNKRGNADDWSFVTFLVALGVATVCAITAGGTGAGVYNKRIDTALYQEMSKAGFDAIQITRSYKNDVPDSLDATLKGKPFVGTIEQLPYPEDFTFLIEEGREG